METAHARHVWGYPQGGYIPSAGVALPVALLLYLIYSVIGSIPTLIQAFAYLIPRVTAGQDPFSLIDDMLADPPSYWWRCS